MDNQQFEQLIKTLLGLVRGIFLVVILMGILSIYFLKFYNPAHFTTEPDIPQVTMEAEPEIKDGIHVATGFIVDTNYELVVTNCTNCHSPKLVTQNRATKEGWRSMIEWMQETQNLWDLGENEEKILEYLAKNYSPGQQGRRKPLSDIEWYELED